MSGLITWLSKPMSDVLQCDIIVFRVNEVPLLIGAYGSLQPIRLVHQHDHFDALMLQTGTPQAVLHRRAVATRVAIPSQGSRQ